MMIKPALALYFDHSATTPVDPRVVQAMEPYWTDHFGNASSLYRYGREARRALERARETVASVLGCPPAAIIFTSGGTESDNAAIKGVIAAQWPTKRHIVTTAIEHEAILHTCEALRKYGIETTLVGVDRDGRVDPQDIERAIRSDTALVSVMMANNEIGTIMPLRTIADIAHRHGICFHTDAVQAPGLLPLAVDQIGADLLSLSAHKFYGPKGMGILYVRPGTHWRPQQHGGSQENRRRAGTENVAGAVGLATALQIAEASRPAEVERLTMLRNRLISYILSRVPKAQLTGHPDNRLAHHASFVFEGVEGESIVMGLDLRGIAASTGSACTSASLDPSHVLLALGLPAHLAVGSLRLSLGRHTTEQAVEQVASAVQEIVARLRNEQRIAAADTAAM